MIFLAAVQLSKKAITDKVTRILVFFGGAAGVLYNALWYFPILVVVGGCVTTVWDYRWGHRLVKAVRDRMKKPSSSGDIDTERQAEQETDQAREMQDISRRESDTHSKGDRESSGLRRIGPTATRDAGGSTDLATDGVQASEAVVQEAGSNAANPSNIGVFSWKVGISVGVGFFLIFIAVMVLRGVLDAPPRWYGIFANLFLAGTSSVACSSLH